MPRFALRSTYVQALAGSFECFAFASRSALRFYCGVLRSAYACLAFLLECFMFVLRLLFDAQHQTGRLAICFVPIPRGSGSPFVRSRGVVRLSGFVGSLRDCAFLCGDPDGVRESEETRRTESTARCKYVFAQSYWLCHVFRGEYAGAEMWKPHCGRPQTCAKEPLTLWTLFIGFAAKYLFARHRNNRYPRIAARTPRSTRVHGKT